MKMKHNAGHLVQHGMALVMALVFLLILTMLGIAAIGTATLEEKMAGNQKDKNTSFQAAETALITGENWIGTQTIKPIFNTSVTNDGLHFPSTSTTPVWESSVWSGSDFITFSGLTTVASAPKYVIEDMGEIPDSGGSLTMPANYKSSGKNLFRITSRATGGTSFAISVVQSTYEKRF